jgi:hypothetical protein
MMNAHDLGVMHEDIFRMIEDLYDDDRMCEGNQMLAHALIKAINIIEAELSLTDAEVMI